MLILEPASAQHKRITIQTYSATRSSSQPAGGPLVAGNDTRLSDITTGDSF